MRLVWYSSSHRLTADCALQACTRVYLHHQIQNNKYFKKKTDRKKKQSKNETSPTKAKRRNERK